VQIEAVDTLASLYEDVLIPEAVRSELMREETPQLVRDWLSQAPAWLTVHPVEEEETGLLLHAGERQVLLLAAERKIALALMDERRGRQIAAQQGLRTKVHWAYC
jgi:predicted nucleic acid-binding protein